MVSGSPLKEDALLWSNSGDCGVSSKLGLEGVCDGPHTVERLSGGKLWSRGCSVPTSIEVERARWEIPTSAEMEPGAARRVPLTVPEEPVRLLLLLRAHFGLALVTLPGVLQPLSVASSGAPRVRWDIGTAEKNGWSLSGSAECETSLSL